MSEPLQEDPNLREGLLDHPAGAGFVSALFGIAVVSFGVQGLDLYGMGVFLAVPFLMGALAALLLCRHRPRPLSECFKAAALSTVFAGAGFLFFGLEGLVCLAMAAVLAIPVAMLGSLFAARLLERRGRHRPQGAVLLVTLAAAPLLMGAEAAVDRQPPLMEVRTAVVVEAPPEVVWQNVVSFSELPPPSEWLFQTGIAYPVRAEIQGSGEGAIRRCVFSTGAFVEPIEVWDEPRLLRFSVSENPPVMREWTPYASIHPPHVEGFLLSRRGQFRLTRLEGGRTLLEGTTWYQHDLWPSSYWRLWSDWILHSIHRRVLEHVRDLSEQQAG